MSESNGALVVLMWILSVIFLIIAGILSWSMVNPQGFWGFIGFLTIWSILSSIGHLLAIAIAGWIERLN